MSRKIQELAQQGSAPRLNGSNRDGSGTSFIKRLEHKRNARQKEAKSSEQSKSGPAPCERAVPGKDYAIRWVEGTGDWYAQAKGHAEWQHKAVTLIRSHLDIEYNISDAGKRGTLSEADKVMHDATLNFGVDFAGPFAGYLKPGIHIISGSKVLITKAPALIEPNEGDCELIWNFITEGFWKADQADAFLGWLQCAVLSLRNDEPGCWRHGQAPAIIGDSGDGKTSLQKCIITPSLTGRACDPIKYLMGKTEFNEQLGENEHWMMSDPPGKRSEAFLSGVKTTVANVGMSIHPKGKRMLDLLTFRRATITLNRDNEAIQLLEGMAASEVDKLMILDFRQPGKYGPDHPDGLPWFKWQKEVNGQIPAFLWRLLNDYKIPEHLRHRRYGVFYRNEIEMRLAAPTAEERDQELAEVLYHGIFSFSDQDGRAIMPPKEIDLTAGRIIDRVRGQHSPVKARAEKCEELQNSKRLGNTLVRWITDYKGDMGLFTISRYELAQNSGRYSYALKRKTP